MMSTASPATIDFEESRHQSNLSEVEIHQSSTARKLRREHWQVEGSAVAAVASQSGSGSSASESNLRRELVEVAAVAGQVEQQRKSK